jgi:hypothetical protein
MCGINIAKNKKKLSSDLWQTVFTYQLCVNDPPLMGGVAAFFALRRTTTTWVRGILQEHPRPRDLKEQITNEKCYVLLQIVFLMNIYYRCNGVKTITAPWRKLSTLHLCNI